MGVQLGTQDKKRTKALSEKIAANLTTEALEVVADLSESPGISNKLVQNKAILESFL